MPVERRTGSKQAMAVGIGIVSVILGIALAWGLLELASGGEPSNQLRPPRSDERSYFFGSGFAAAQRRYASIV